AHQRAWIEDLIREGKDDVDRVLLAVGVRVTILRHQECILPGEAGQAIRVDEGTTWVRQTDGGRGIAHAEANAAQRGSADDIVAHGDRALNATAGRTGRRDELTGLTSRGDCVVALFATLGDEAVAADRSLAQRGAAIVLIVVPVVALLHPGLDEPVCALGRVALHARIGRIVVAVVALLAG